MPPLRELNYKYIVVLGTPRLFPHLHFVTSERSEPVASVVSEGRVRSVAYGARNSQGSRQAHRRRV